MPKNAALTSISRVTRAPTKDDPRRKLCRLGDRAVDPAHQVAQSLTDDLDGVLSVFLTQLLELLVATLDVGDQLLGEVAILDVAQDVAHPVLGGGVDDTRTGQVAAELGG